MWGSMGGYVPLSSVTPILSGSDDLEYIKAIGSGGMSNVDLYRSLNDDYPPYVAVKTFISRHMSDREREYLRREADILASFDHVNIVRTHGLAKIHSWYGLVLDYHPYGSCVDFFGTIWARRVKTEEDETNLSSIKIRILGEIVSGMKYLHKPRQFFDCTEYNNTLHLDLKPENVLLDHDLHAKICDFGLSRISTLTDNRTSTYARSNEGVGGTLGFISPERLESSQYIPTTKCDVYAFGILQYTILTDLPPYEDHLMGVRSLLVHHVINNNSRPDDSRVSQAYPDHLTVLMNKCWSPMPEHRPSFKVLDREMLKIRRSIDDFDGKSEDSMKIAKDMYQDSLPPPPPRPPRPQTPPPPPPLGCWDICWQACGRLMSELRKFCSLTRVLGIGAFGLILFAGFITIIVIAQKNQKPENRKTQTDQSCPAINHPAHGDVLCTKAGTNSITQCRFQCNQGYTLVGIETTACVGGNWTSPTPSCKRACKNLPQTGNGVLTCSNKTFVDSICSLSCDGRDFVQETHLTQCLKNATWSIPTLSCTCAECRVGAHCEHSTSWKRVSANLNIMQPYSTASVDYGGNTIVCTINLHSLAFDWKGICVDSDFSVTKTCSEGHTSPPASAEAAASQLIRELSKKGMYPRPCDAELMPTNC